MITNFPRLLKTCRCGSTNNMSKAVLAALARSVTDKAWCLQPRATFKDREPQSLGVASQRDHTKYVESFSSTLEGLRMASFSALPGALVIQTKLRTIHDAIEHYMTQHSDLTFVVARNKLFYAFFELDDKYTKTRVVPTSDASLLNKEVFAILRGFENFSGGVISTRSGGHFVKKLVLNGNVQELTEKVVTEQNITQYCNSKCLNFLLTNRSATFGVDGSVITILRLNDIVFPYPDAWSNLIKEAVKQTNQLFANSETPSSGTTTTTTTKTTTTNTEWDSEAAKKRYESLKQRYNQILAFAKICKAPPTPLGDSLLEKWNQLSFNESWERIRDNGGAYLDSWFFEKRKVPTTNTLVQLDLSVDQEFEACAEWYALTSVLYKEVNALPTLKANKTSAKSLTFLTSVNNLNQGKTLSVELLKRILLVWLSALKIKLSGVFSTFKTIDQLMTLSEELDQIESEIKLTPSDALQYSNVSTWMSFVNYHLANYLPILLTNLYGNHKLRWFNSPPSVLNPRVLYYQYKNADELEPIQYRRINLNDEQIHTVTNVRNNIPEPNILRNQEFSDGATLDVRGISELLATINVSTYIETNQLQNYIDIEESEVSLYCLCKAVSHLAQYKTGKNQVNVFVKLCVTPYTASFDNGFWVAPQQYNDKKPTLIVNVQRSITSTKPTCRIVRIDCNAQLQTSHTATEQTHERTQQISSPEQFGRPPSLGQFEPPREITSLEQSGHTATLQQPGQLTTLNQPVQSTSPGQPERLATPLTVNQAMHNVVPQSGVQTSVRTQTFYDCRYCVETMITFIVILTIASMVLVGATWYYGLPNLEDVATDITDSMYKRLCTSQFERFVKNLPVITTVNSETWIKLYQEIGQRTELLGGLDVIKINTMTFCAYFALSVFFAFGIYKATRDDRNMTFGMAIVNSMFTYFLSVGQITEFTVASACASAIITCCTLMYNAKQHIINDLAIKREACKKLWNTTEDPVFVDPTTYDTINYIHCKLQIKVACPLTFTQNESEVS